MDKDTLQHNPPPIPLIADESGNNVGYRDTLDRVAAVLQLLNEMDSSEGLSPRAKSGRYWILLMLIDSVKYISDALVDEKSGN